MEFRSDQLCVIMKTPLICEEEDGFAKESPFLFDHKNRNLPQILNYRQAQKTNNKYNYDDDETTIKNKTVDLDTPRLLEHYVLK